MDPLTDYLSEEIGDRRLLATSEGPVISDNLTSQPMWIVMASSESSTSERPAELVRLQAERARANGHKPGQMVEGAEIIVVRRNPETGRKQFDLLRWGLVPHWAPDMSGGWNASCIIWGWLWAAARQLAWHDG